MPDGLFHKNPPGGGSFGRVPRWLGRHSPLRGCSDLAALATTEIPRRSAPRSFQTGSLAVKCGALRIYRPVRAVQRRSRGGANRCKGGENKAGGGGGEGGGGRAGDGPP